MKILTPGKIPMVIPPPWWVGQMPICSNCAACFELESSDVSRVCERAGRYSPHRRYAMVTCPFCDCCVVHEEVFVLPLPAVSVPLH